MAKYFSPEIETASRDYLHAIQSARLIKTVKRCYENIPFYKAKFDEIGLKPEDIHSIDDISKLPFTVKQDLRDHYPFGLFAVPRDELVRVHASSGTTGKQTVVGYTRGDIDRYLGEAIYIICLDFEHILKLGAHVLTPRLCAENTYAKRQLSGIDIHLFECLCDKQSV